MPAQSITALYFSALHQKGASLGAPMALVTMEIMHMLLKYKDNTIFGTDPAISWLQIRIAHAMRPQQFELC
jgi:hypothetical protein